MRGGGIHMASITRPVLWPEIRGLILSAMVIFTYTIVIGILNGADLVDFDQRRILGHVHGGTLGWLTLSVFAASLWLFGDDARLAASHRKNIRYLSIAAIVSFVLYVIAFSTTYNESRPILGVTAVIVTAGFAGWVLMRARVVELSVPHWGFLAALGTSIVGGVLGVLLGLEIATGDNYLPDGGEGAHPATMVVGFLIPVALAMAEWAFFFPHPPKATRIGVIQMVFPFIGGFLLMLSLLLDIVPLAPIAVLLEFIGVGIFLKRMWPSFRGVDTSAVTPGLHAIASTIGVILVLAIAQYFIIRYEGDFDLVEENQLLALDHLQFIGAMTNALFAMILAATIGTGRANRMHTLIFALVNIGILGFALGLFLDVTAMKRIFAPIMGVGLLIGLGYFAMALLNDTSPAPTAKSRR